MNAAKEKLEIVSGAAPRYHPPSAELRGRPPPFRHTTTAPLSAFAGCRIFAGGFFRKNAFGLIQEYCTGFANRSEKFSASIDCDELLIPPRAPREFFRRFARKQKFSLRFPMCDHLVLNFRGKNQFTISLLGQEVFNPYEIRK